MTPSNVGAAFPVEVLRQGLAFGFLALLVVFFLERDRRHALNRLALYVISLALRLASALLPSISMPSAGRTTGFLALLLQGIAFLGLAAVLLFDLLLPLARIRVPRIVRDLAVALSWVGLLLWLFSVHQVDVTGIVATSAVVTAVIGFSLQDTLANVMGGIALQIEGARRAGRLGEVRRRGGEASGRRAGGTPRSRRATATRSSSRTASS